MSKRQMTIFETGWGIIGATCASMSKTIALSRLLEYCLARFRRRIDKIPATVPMIGKNQTNFSTSGGRARPISTRSTPEITSKAPLERGTCLAEFHLLDSIIKIPKVGINRTTERKNSLLGRSAYSRRVAKTMKGNQKRDEADCKKKHCLLNTRGTITINSDKHMAIKIRILLIWLMSIINTLLPNSRMAVWIIQWDVSYIY